MLRSLAFAVVILLAAAAPASAQTAQEQAACQDDAMRVCSADIPDRDRVFHCLVAKRDAISPACRSVLARFLPSDAPAQRTSTQRPRKGQPLDLGTSGR